MNWNSGPCLDGDGFIGRRVALTAAHGQPVHVSGTAACRLLGGAAAGLNPCDVLAFAYPTREAAQAFHQLAADEYGHDSLGIAADPEGGGFVGVVDVRAAVARMRSANDALRRNTP